MAAHHTDIAPHPKPELQGLRTCIAVSIYCGSIIMFFCLVAFVVILFLTVSGKFGADAIEKIALGTSLQVSLGMVIGLFSIIIGLMLTWFEFRASFELSGKAGEKGEVSLKSASPGLLFFVGGITLICFALNKELKFEDRGGAPTVLPINNPEKKKVNGVVPKTLPP